MSLETQTRLEENLLKLFNENSFREILSVEDFRTYITTKKDLTFKKGEAVFDENEAPNGIYFIKKGTLKLSKCGVYGKDQILKFIKEGDFIGYRSLLIGEHFQAKAEAMTPVEATFISKEFFLHLLEAAPKLCFAMLQKFAYELGESSNTITVLAQKTVRERLAEILLLLEQKLGRDPEGFIKISLTREEIANLVGTATESAIRLISEFKHDGLIVTEGRNIKIINRDRLKKVGHISI
ncbi:MAG: Crp/Fnr family transcriptional regulator [Bergeyella zoohelcum]|nr:Crp/Fnr family transcriptional regulator [Bergeyella zoohelcum]